MTAARKSIRGPHSRQKRCSRRARLSRSARGLLPRRRRRAWCWCDSRTAATSAPRRCDHLPRLRCIMARILIAEDETSLRVLVARALAQDGHEVTTAHDGAEALDTLTRATG